MTPRTVSKEIKKRMKQINVSHRAYFLKGQASIRLCHIEQGHYKYITIPFCDCDALEQAAIILKRCGIVDGYRMEQISDEQFYVVLFQYKYQRRFDAKGNVLNLLVHKAVEWGDLSLTRDDVKEFIAHYELMNTAPHRTPCMPMVAGCTPQPQVRQFEPYNFYKQAA